MDGYIISATLCCIKLWAVISLFSFFSLSMPWVCVVQICIYLQDVFFYTCIVFAVELCCIKLWAEYYLPVGLSL